MAVGFAYLFDRYHWLYELSRPVLSIMRSVPVISFVLLALILLHKESIPFLIGFLVMFPLLTENLTKGIQQLQHDYSFFAKVFLIKGKNRLLHIYYPQLKPFLFSGLASAMGFGWRAIIMGEVLSQCNWGIGSEMKRAQMFIEIPELLAWTVIAIFVSFIFDKGISRLEHVQIPLFFTSSFKYVSPTKLNILIEDISFSYGEKEIITHFSYKFETGNIYAISAPSGKGKTTLLHLIDGTLSPEYGFINMRRDKGISSVFQEPVLLNHLSVRNNIKLPLATFYAEKAANKMTDKVLSEMELTTLADKNPAKLSYGQQQRVAIARALAFPSPYLLLDEPFKGLDKPLKFRIIQSILHQQKETERIIILTSHNTEEINEITDKFIFL